mgnify:CR=1 FL=1
MSIHKEIKKVTTHTLLNMKQAGEKISMLTAYDFSKDPMINKNNPRYRLTSSYQFYKNFYIQAGVQDIANKDFRTMFVGGGIRWKDEDLKKLLGLASLGR